MKHILLSTIFALLATCGQSPTDVIPKSIRAGESPRQGPKKLQFAKIDTPYDFSALALIDNKVLAIGESGLSDLTTGVAPVALWNYQIRQEFVTNNNGLSAKPSISRKKFHDDNRSYPYVCKPKSAAGRFSRLYVYADCEHGEQIWRADLRKNPALLTVLNFDVSAEDDLVFGRQFVGFVGETVLMPSISHGHPVILTQQPTSDLWKPLWVGANYRGVITAMNFDGNIGWMCLIGGEILESRDAGHNWDLTTELPLKADEMVTDIRFHEGVGYIATDKQLLVTSDAGKVWTRVGEVKNGGNKVVVGETGAFFLSNNTIWRRDRDPDMWQALDDVPSGSINDMLVTDTGLFILVDNHPYFASY
jgi:hypothetical protein